MSDLKYWVIELVVDHFFPRASMHPCLYIAELAYRIAEECAPGYRSADVYTELDLRSVYALARTCRTLQVPALDVVWYNQCGLRHLLLCMPDDLWTRYRRVEGGRSYEYMVFAPIPPPGLRSFMVIYTTATPTRSPARRLGSR